MLLPIIDCCLITAENNGVNNIWVPKLQNPTSKGDTKFFEQVNAMLLIFVKKIIDKSVRVDTNGLDSVFFLN